MSAPLHPRVPASTCVKCRRLFRPGDRTTMVFIIHKAGLNPHNPREMGSVVGEEFEMAHVDCADPQISGMIVLGDSK